ncbi:PD-(D/E)XK motif protein [Nitrospina sp. 32_T5]|uniref:PD-(D/E)XK motif protein n=1 Tax=unclassified Nitrospina TaxID=2638683 RepID=UPI003F98EB89
MMNEQLWKELEKKSGETPGSGILKRLVNPGQPCPMLLGIKHPGASRTFILEVPRENALLLEDIPPSRGFDFTSKITGDEIHSDHMSLILSASGPDYNEIFSAICEDLLSHLHSAGGAAKMISSFQARVRLWQVFFEKQALEGLGPDAQMGLYGELYFFERFVMSGPGNIQRGLKAWVGPESRQQDFQFGSLSVEVKITASKQHQKLRIASEQQLDEASVRKLYLYCLSVSLVENNTETLPEIIRRIKNSLENEPGALELFNNSLLKMGYLDIHAQRYGNTGYFPRDSKPFLVRDNFPRIKEKELRQGVGDVSYSISVAECMDYEVPEDELISEIQGALR